MVEFWTALKGGAVTTPGSRTSVTTSVTTSVATDNYLADR